MLKHSTIVGLMALSFVCAGCKEDKGSTPEATSAKPVASAAPSASAAAPAPDTTTVIPAPTLLAVKLPRPPSVPATAVWTPVSGAGGDGDVLTNLVDNKSDYWLRVRFVDCNAPVVKTFADKPADERGDIGNCYATPTGKLGEYPIVKSTNNYRAIKVGHLTIAASSGMAVKKPLTGEELDAFLQGIDLAALAKQ